PDEQKETDMPRRIHLIINSTTIEAREGALQTNPHGVLSFNDELSEWFASMERYHTSRGDRPAWLQLYEGGPRTSIRVGRGDVVVPNWSAGIHGGIQPGRIIDIARRAPDDGLLQRFVYVISRGSSVARDLEATHREDDYEDLIRRLYSLRKGRIPRCLKFSPDAQKIFYRFQEETQERSAFKSFDAKLTTAFLKGDALFCRLCVVFHCIERLEEWHAYDITGEVAARVERLMNKFIRPHQMIFFAHVLG